MKIKWVRVRDQGLICGLYYCLKAFVIWLIYGITYLIESFDINSLLGEDENIDDDEEDIDDFEKELKKVGGSAVRIQHGIKTTPNPRFKAIYLEAMNEFLEFNNGSYKNPIHIEDWCPVLVNEKWDANKIAILIGNGNKYVADVTYSNLMAKDGNPRVKYIRTRDFILTGKPQKELSQETLNKSVMSTLKDPAILAYCDSATNTYLQNGEVVFNALIALGMKVESFMEKYSTERHIKAWEYALADRFGGGLENPTVREVSAGIFKVTAEGKK